MLHRSIFTDVRFVGIGVVLLFILLHLTLKWAIFSPAFLTYIANPAYDATDGAVSHSAIAGMISTLALIGFILAAGRIRASELGLERGLLLNGVLVTLFLWSLSQTASVAFGQVYGGGLNFGHPWNPGTAVWAGVLDAHASGALVEEVVYRGFLMPQLYLLIRTRWRWSVVSALGAAAAISQAYFALHHIPAALRMGLPPGEAVMYLIQVFFVGLFFVAIYLRTGNLFVAVGVHALLNYPGALFVSRIDPSLVVLVLSCVILVVWPYLNRSLSDVFTLRPLGSSPGLAVPGP